MGKGKLKWSNFKVELALKSDLNKVIFVSELWELLCKDIKITTICIFKKNSTHKKYLNNNDFPLLSFGFIRMKVGITTFLPGCCDVVPYKVIRK